MKNNSRIPARILYSSLVLSGLLFGGVHVLARQTPQATSTSALPCNDPPSAEKKKETLDYEPFADPAEVLRVRAQKKFEEKNFKELQDSATQLATISEKMNREIEKGGQYAVSLRVMDELSQIEKLTKKVRSLTK